MILQMLDEGDVWEIVQEIHWEGKKALKRSKCNDKLKCGATHVTDVCNYKDIRPQKILMIYFTYC